MSSICFTEKENNQTINLELSKINLIRQKQKIVDFNIELLCPYSVYQDIEKESYFNLFAEIKSPLIINNFQPDLPIKLKLTIDQNLQKDLVYNTQSKEQIEQYLVNPRSLFAEYPKENWLINDWYCLQVNQKQENETIGYSTLWNKITVKKTKAKNRKNQNQQNFWTEAEVEKMSSEWEKAGDKIGELFDDLIETLDENLTQKQAKPKTISQVTKEFCREDNWNYLQLNDGITLQLSCQGQNGQINCYARSYDQQNQLIFYALYPLVIPEEKRINIAELITKINYGMIIGNFELDFNDGELRYKTSIDVDGDRLSTALVKRLVYNNVLTIDQYLPAITAVINEELTIDAALLSVEGD